jgi:hypothetical protein
LLAAHWTIALLGATIHALPALPAGVLFQTQHHLKQHQNWTKVQFSNQSSRWGTLVGDDP